MLLIVWLYVIVFVSLLLFAHSGVQHILCCIFAMVWVYRAKRSTLKRGCNLRCSGWVSSSRSTYGTRLVIPYAVLGLLCNCLLQKRAARLQSDVNVFEAMFACSMSDLRNARYVYFGLFPFQLYSIREIVFGPFSFMNIHVISLLDRIVHTMYSSNIVIHIIYAGESLFYNLSNNNVFSSCSIAIHL